MPIISTFFGIVIRMYYQDHEPANFHAEYQGRQAKFTFDGELLAGDLSGTARRLVREWAALHRVELQENWARMLAGEQLDRIAPLE
jgi:hypothetical protein